MYTANFDFNDVVLSGSASYQISNQSSRNQPLHPSSAEGHLRFSGIKQAAVITFLDPVNLVRGCKYGVYALASSILLAVKKGFEILGNSEEITSSLNKKVNVLDLKGAHELAKIVHVWGKFNFGDQILVKVRNVGKVSELDLVHDVNNQKRQDIKNTLVKNVFTENLSMNRLDAALDETAITDGICKAACVWFVKNCLEIHPLSKQRLVELAESCRNGFPYEAVLNQAIYELNPTEDALDQLNGLKTDKGQHAIITNKDKKGLLSHGFYQSTDEQLSSSHYNDLTDGVYELSFATGDGWHAISMVKLSGESFLFDPNFGLIDCRDDPQGNLLRLLRCYEPPENNHSPAVNYSLSLKKYIKSS